MDAVAGGVNGAVDDVSGLLSAEDRAPLEHHLQHVLVADVRAAKLDAVVLELLLEAEVRHHRRDHASALQLTALPEMLRPEVDDLVAVADVARVVGEDRAIGIAVE